MNPLNKTHFEYNHRTERPDLVYTYRRIYLPKFARKRIPTAVIMKYERWIIPVMILGLAFIFWLYYVGLKIVGQIISVIFLVVLLYVIIKLLTQFSIVSRKAVITEEEHTEILRVGKKIDLLMFQWKDSCMYNNMFYIVSQEEYNKITKKVVN